MAQLHAKKKLFPLSDDDKLEEREEELDEVMAPDSTTHTERFKCGDDVLLRQQDGLFYFGTITQVDDDRDTCLVTFGDNTQHWSAIGDLTRLETANSDVLCVVCKGGDSSCDNQILLCDHCARGYHQKCNDPPVSGTWVDSDGPWLCIKCQQRASRETANATPIKKITDITNDLPYDPSTLQWDRLHRTNSAGHYCYCGLRGDWFRGMLQCQRCLQWFHSGCVNSLPYPLLCGDRFYWFQCRLCSDNGRDEVLKRLPLSWDNVAHLLLFHLTLTYARKYHHVEDTVLPFLEQHWVEEQMPNTVQKANWDERKQRIISVLKSDRNRFKSGSEVKRRGCIFGLRTRSPPTPVSTSIEEDLSPPCLNAVTSLTETPPRATTPTPPTLTRYTPETHDTEAAKRRLRCRPTRPPSPTPPKVERSQTQQKNIKRNSSSMKPPVPSTTALDTSGDETSSRGTVLEFFIPPPKDFEGRNHPFRSSPRGRGGRSRARLPRLSRHPIPLFPPPNPTVLARDLRSYWGAPHRIASGRPFSVKGQRLTPSGKMHYLIEWE